MPSIQDVADQINAKLDQITVNTTETVQNTADTVTIAKDIKNELVQVNIRLTTIDNDLNIGFANLSQGLFAINELQKVSVALLERNREQNDTIICLLENSNEMLCGITRKFTQQLAFSAATLSSAKRIEGILERVHPGEAADYDRLASVRADLEKCCPSEVPPLEACPKPCANSEYRPPRPKGQDWQPLPPPPTDRPIA